MLQPEAPQPPEEGPQVDAPDWSNWELGRALRMLKGNNIALQKKTIRKLHLRWWHCSAARITSLLRAAGCPPQVLAFIQPIIDTCQVCRMFSRLGIKASLSSRIAERFNEVLQVDLVFCVYDYIVLHIVDEYIRWSAGMLIKNKETGELLEAFTHCWVRLFGAPKTIITDKEGGFYSDQAAIWLIDGVLASDSKPRALTRTSLNVTTKS